MIIPIRCFSCGKPIADKFDSFKASVASGQDPAETLVGLGFDRYCCTRMFLSNVELFPEIKKYQRF